MMDGREEDTDVERLRRLEWTLYGLTGSNGLVSEVQRMRTDLEEFINREAQRREGEIERDRQRDRAVAVAALASIVTLIGVIATLIVVVPSG